MLNKSSTVAFICGGTVLAATILIYLLMPGSLFAVSLRWISLLFLIAAEIIGTVKAAFIKKSVLGVANITVSVFHAAAVLLLSVLFMILFPGLVRAYILWNILLLCVLVAADVLLLYAGRSVSAKNKKLAESQQILDACCAKAQEIGIQEAYKKDLQEITEMLRYADNSALSGDEGDILNKLSELQTLENEAALEKIKEIKNLIQLRSIKISAGKRGGY